MKKIIISLYFAVVIFYFLGCSHLSEVDRSQVNRPSMNLESPMLANNQATLTNQKSSNSISIGSCSVCAH